MVYKICCQFATIGLELEVGENSAPKLNIQYFLFICKVLLFKFKAQFYFLAITSDRVEVIDKGDLEKFKPAFGNNNYHILRYF